MPMRREDKELSKYSEYKARVDLTKIRQVASVLALLARSLGLCWGGLYLLASARVCLCWLCVRFRTARVASCHGRDIGSSHVYRSRSCRIKSVMIFLKPINRSSETYFEGIPWIPCEDLPSDLDVGQEWNHSLGVPCTHLVSPSTF